MSVEIRFDPNQQYQREAIDSVVELFSGQEGLEQGLGMPSFTEDGSLFEELVFGNRLDLSAETIRKNLRRVQDRPVLLDDGNEVPAVAESSRQEIADGEVPDNFNIEMETGTGKTYVYLRTIVELHLKYGFRKFVIVVPSVAIREGVLNSLQLLKDHIRGPLRWSPVQPPCLSRWSPGPSTPVRDRVTSADHGHQHCRDDW